MSALVTALNQLGFQAFGISMPLLAPAWAPNGVTANFSKRWSWPSQLGHRVRRPEMCGRPIHSMLALAGISDDDFTLTISGGNWAAPIAAVSRVVNAGEGLGVSLFQADGTMETGPGVLLTVFAQEYIRLGHLYASILEAPQANRPEQALGLPWRPVPMYFFYPGAITGNDKNGFIQPWDDLNRQGPMRVYDGGGLPIDVLAVASALGVLMGRSSTCRRPRFLPRSNPTIFR